jgi:tryptophan synthase alpha chain
MSLQTGQRRGLPVEEHFRARRSEGRKLLVPYITGAVTLDWLDYIRAYADAGADAVEIGLPFSDPMLDGPLIQAASHQALRNGATVARVLDELAGLDAPIPLIAMTYGNLVVHAGSTRFCSELAAAGVRGLIVPDVPVDEADALTTDAQAAGVDLTLLVAPSTTPPRQAWIARRSRGFVYAVTTMGTTGVRDRVDDAGLELAARLKLLSDLPVLLGFGISSPAQALAGAEVADGVVVASELMRLVLDGMSASALGERVAALRCAVDG